MTAQHSFKNQLESIYHKNSFSQDLLKNLREKAWNNFLNSNFPSFDSEVYKYVPLHKLLAKKFSVPPLPNKLTKEEINKFIFPECLKSHLVLINGYYSKEHSCVEDLSDKIIFLDLEHASKTYGAFLNNHWTKFLKEETDPLTLINSALQKQGLFIYLPPNQVVETPIQIIHIVDDLIEESILIPRIQVFVGKNSSLEIYSTWNNLTKIDIIANQMIDFSIDENAHVLYSQIMTDREEKNWFFDAVRATLKRNSQFKSININTGLETYRNDYKISLTQEGANAELDGIWMLGEKRETHTNVLIDHQAPHCTSRQFFKGVLKDSSKSSFEGKILVRQIAQKTDAFQLNNNLLLNEKSQAFSKPNLEIFADDVKASHGSTIGKLDEEEEFYLRSRGFSKLEAKNLLIYGYCEEIIERIKLTSLKEQLKNLAESFVT